ncbi:hypothetical protein Tco_0697480 [Tanacetum coccineum]
MKETSNEAKVKNDIDSVKNADLKAQIQKNVFANATLKNELRKLKGSSVDTKFAKASILGKPDLQPLRNQSVVRQPTAFRSERPKFSKPRFAYQVDVKNDFPKPITPHYLPKVRESAFVKPHHVIASGSSRNSSKESYGSNDMAHKNYLKKCVFNANHDDCITKFLKEVNSRAKVQSPKSRNNIKPAKRIPNVNKLERWISKGYRFSLNKSFAVHEKPNTLRSCLRWKPTGRIFKNAGLRWIPVGKMFTDSTTKVDSEPPNGSNDDITNLYECDQTLNVSADLAPQRKERCTLQCTLFLKEEKSSYSRAVLSTTSISSHARSVNKWINYFKPPPNVDHPVPEVPTPVPAGSTSSPSSTTVDQDAPSTSEQFQKTDHVFNFIRVIRSDTYTRNPVNDILLKLNLPDHMSVLMDLEDQVKMEMEIPHSSGVNFITACSYSTDTSKDIMKAQVYVSKLSQL